MTSTIRQMAIIVIVVLEKASCPNQFPYQIASFHAYTAISFVMTSAQGSKMQKYEERLIARINCRKLTLPDKRVRPRNSIFR